MKHKRQTVSKDETDIKTPKCKGDSSLCVAGDGKCGVGSGCEGCELPPGAAHPGIKDEDEEHQGDVKVRQEEQFNEVLTLHILRRRS